MVGSQQGDVVRPSMQANVDGALCRVPLVVLVCIYEFARAIDHYAHQIVAVVAIFDSYDHHGPALAIFRTPLSGLRSLPTQVKSNIAPN